MNIKKTKLAITLTGVLFLSLPMSQAFAHQDHCEIKETQLGETMKYIKSELRAYVKGFKKGDRQKMQKHLDELLKLSVMANKHTPAKIMMMKPDGMKNRASDDMSAMDHSSMKADDMSAMDHSSMKADDMSAMDHSSMKADDMSAMDHSSMKADDMSAMDHSSMKADDMSAMDHSSMKAGNMSVMDHSNMKADDMSAMNHSKMDHGDMQMDSVDHDMASMPSMQGMSSDQHHQHMKYMQGMTELQDLFKALDKAKDNNEIKTILGKIKQHSKKSHQQFRLDC